MTTENRVQLANESIQHLTNAILTNGVTKEKIEDLANMLADSATNPKNAWVMLNVIDSLVTATKDALKEKAMKDVENTLESQRKIGNIRYDMQTRTTINYGESEICKSIEANLKAEKTIIKKKVDEAIVHLEETGEAVFVPVSYTRTKYLKVTLPKD